MTYENKGAQQTPDPLPAEPHARIIALEDRARMFLESLDHADHPLARQDPVYALYQIAVDYRCLARGYEGLLKRERGEEP